MERTYEDIPEYIEWLNSVDLSYSGTTSQYVESRKTNVQRTRNFLARVGVTQEDVDRLSVIHVTGTKGKGSTCAFTESILREHGYKTGFLSSPHLIEQRERVRINGKPLARDHFAREFFEVFDQLEATKDQRTLEGVIPSLFQFFVVLGLKLSIKLKVDVVIMEVGIGGESDCSNVMRKTVACGFTILDLDHTDILGNTISEIGYRKAGIMKQGAPAYVLPPSDEGLSALLARAKERKCPLYVVPALEEYDWGGKMVEPGIAGEFQKWNASLAIQLTQAWMNLHQKPPSVRQAPVERPETFTIRDVPTASTFTVPYKTRIGLENCRWAARSHVISRHHVTYYIDGAHTDKSLQECAKWFHTSSEAERLSEKCEVAKILIFNLFKLRPAESLLSTLLDIDFDAVVFCPIIADEKERQNDSEYADDVLERCYNNNAVWQHLKKEKVKLNRKKLSSPILDQLNGHGIMNMGGVDTKTNANERNDEVRTKVLNSVTEALVWAGANRDSELEHISDGLPEFLPESLRAGRIQVLVTGSMKLAGCALHVLDPDVTDRDEPPKRPV